MIRSTDLDPFVDKTGPARSEQGVTSARNYSLSASLVGGVLGTGSLEVDLAGMKYNSTDGARKTAAEKVFFNMYKNQRPFGPTSIQLGMGGDDFVETRSSNGEQTDRLRIGNFHQNLFIGATDISKAISAIWKGGSIQSAMFADNGAAVRDALDKARAIELNYEFSNFSYDHFQTSFIIDGFSVKLQSQMCGGCEARFDIGIDGPQVLDNDALFAIESMMPDHAYASGAISGFDFAPLIASKDAFINPFRDEIFSFPTLPHQKAFSIPAFKLSVFDRDIDIGATGFLDIRYENGWIVNGKIEASLKKGEEKMNRLMALRPTNKKAAKLKNVIRSAFLQGLRDKDGKLVYTIDIKDNAVRINSTPL